MLLPELAALDQLRRRREWTFEQLSSTMARANAHVSYRTLHNLLTGRTTKPHDRTLARVQKFLRSSLAKPRARKRRVPVPASAPEVAL